MINKVVYNVLSVIILAVVIYLCIINWHNAATSQFCTDFNGNIIITHTYIVVITAYILGKISGIACSLSFGGRYREQLEFYARKNEKLAQQNEIDTDDKEALQRKIAALEIALDNALKNKNN